MPKLFILLWRQDSVFHPSSGPHFSMVTWHINHTCSLSLIRFVKLVMFVLYPCSYLEEHSNVLKELKRQLVGESYVFKYPTLYYFISFYYFFNFQNKWQEAVGKHIQGSSIKAAWLSESVVNLCFDPRERIWLIRSKVSKCLMMNFIGQILRWKFHSSLILLLWNLKTLENLFSMLTE